VEEAEPVTWSGAKVILRPGDVGDPTNPRLFANPFSPVIVIVEFASVPTLTIPVELALILKSTTLKIIRLVM